MEPPVVHSQGLQAWVPLATSLAIGFLIGLERQRSPTAKAGVRTCALVAVFGTVAALLAETLAAPWIVAAGLIVTGAMIIAAYLGPENHETDSGTTTVIAVVLCYGLGAMVWYGYMQLAVALAIAITVLLHFKAQLHAFSEKLAPNDVSIVLQFAVLSFIVLPLLPNEGYGPYRVLNPNHIWLMVVLVSGLSVAGYFALRMLGERRGTLLVGVFGGLVSSTATTLVHARQAGRNGQSVPLSAAVIATSNLIVPVRISILAAVTAAGIAPTLLPALAIGIACGLLPVVQRLRSVMGRTSTAIPEMSNPASLPVALAFGAVYAVVLVLSAWLSDRVGQGGLLALAAVSGLTDMDAITLSSLRLFDTGAVPAESAAVAIFVAFSAATLFKLAAVAWFGGRALARATWPALIAPVAGTAAGLLIMGVV